MDRQVTVRWRGLSVDCWLPPRRLHAPLPPALARAEAADALAAAQREVEAAALNSMWVQMHAREQVAAWGDEDLIQAASLLSWMGRT